jgi:hypothetical protein
MRFYGAFFVGAFAPDKIDAAMALTPPRPSRLMSICFTENSILSKSALLSWAAGAC